MFTQFHNFFAQRHNLLFLMANQVQRHAAARGVALRVKTDPWSFKAFAEMVADALSTLPDRERQIVDLYYFKDLTFKEIGEVMGVTESRISQLHTRLKNRLFSRLQSVVEED